MRPTPREREWLTSASPAARKWLASFGHAEGWAQAEGPPGDTWVLLEAPPQRCAWGSHAWLPSDPTILCEAAVHLVPRGMVWWSVDREQRVEIHGDLFLAPRGDEAKSVRERALALFLVAWDRFGTEDPATDDRQLDAFAPRR